MMPSTVSDLAGDAAGAGVHDRLEHPAIKHPDLVVGRTARERRGFRSAWVILAILPNDVRLDEPRRYSSSNKSPWRPGHERAEGAEF